MKQIFLVTIVLALLAACGPTPTQSPDTPVDSGDSPNSLPPIYAPRPGDDQLQRGEVFDVTAELLAMESFPVQYAVILRGNLPTPCHELRVIVHEPDADNRIQLETYSVTDPARICVQMLQPFEQNVYLGSFPSGHYTVWVNGEQVTEFDA